MAEDQSHGDTHQTKKTAEVAAKHDAFAIPAINQCAGR